MRSTDFLSIIIIIIIIILSSSSSSSSVVLFFSFLYYKNFIKGSGIFFLNAKRFRCKFKLGKAEIYFHLFLFTALQINVFLCVVKKGC